jgi:hypothetical protein
MVERHLVSRGTLPNGGSVGAISHVCKLGSASEPDDRADNPKNISLNLAAVRASYFRLEFVLSID